MQDRFLRACRRESVDRTPVWFMRQAGRYMREYRALREKHSMLELCRTPDLAVEVTLQPVHALEIDAAILFADILLPIAPMGVPFDFARGEGPVISKPVRSRADIDALRVIDPDEDLGYVMKTVSILRRELAGKTPLIGFAGAPFTLASYLVEGGKSTHFIYTKQLMYADAPAWHVLMEKLTEVTARYLTAQVKAGAQAIQLFDSWIGALSPDDYVTYVQPHVRRIFERLATLDVPTIHFGTGASTLLPLIREAGGSVIGVDWREHIDAAWTRIGEDRAVQGNLDPTLLLAPWEVLEARARDILKRVRGRKGHVFNLGHGILPETPVDNVKRLAAFVHSESERK